MTPEEHAARWHSSAFWAAFDAGEPDQKAALIGDAVREAVLEERRAILLLAAMLMSTDPSDPQYAGALAFYERFTAAVLSRFD